MTSLYQHLRHQYKTGSLSKAAFIKKMHECVHSSLFSYAQHLDQTDISLIEISAGRVLMTSRLDGIRIAVDVEDQRTAPIEILNFGFYEPEETEVIRRVIAEKDMDTMLDIGANIGWYSLMASKLNHNASIHAFEPIPSTYHKLIENCLLNSSDKLECHNYGFSTEVGSFPFYFYPEGGVNASMQNLAKREDAMIIECEVRPLNSVLQWLPVNSRIDFIKCDVEGNELFVLQGGLDLLKQYKPILLCELLRKWSASFGYHPNEVIDLLQQLGYKPYTCSSTGHLCEFNRITNKTIQTNFFFVHPESRLREAALHRV